MQTKERIIRAAIEILVDDKDASLERIALKAGVSRVTIHRHFTCRESLIIGVQNELIKNANNIMDKAIGSSINPLKQLKAIINESIYQINGFPLLMDACHHHHHDDYDDEEDLDVQSQDVKNCPFSDVNRKLINLIEKLKEKGIVRPEIPLAWAFHLLDGVILTAWETLRNGSIAPRDISKLAWETYTGGVFINAR